MTPQQSAYRVSIAPVASQGLSGGTLSHWVRTEERAKEIVAAQPESRSYEAVPWAELPDKVRANFERQPAA